MIHAGNRTVTDGAIRECLRLSSLHRIVEEHVGADRTSRVDGNRIDVVTGNADARVSGTLTTRVDGRERRDVQHDATLAYGEDLTARVHGCMTTVVGKASAKRSWVTHAERNAKLSSLDWTYRPKSWSQKHAKTSGGRNQVSCQRTLS